MPRSVASVKKRNKAAKARKSFWKRRKVIDLIETTADNVPETPTWNTLIKELSELHVERSIVLPSNLHANRLVEIAYFVEQSRRLGIHDAKCTIGKMEFRHKTRNGLLSYFMYFCHIRENQIKIKTHHGDGVNENFVWDGSVIGLGYSQSEELLSVLNFPVMTKKTYKKLKMGLHDKWQQLLSKDMQKSADEEKKFVIEAGNLEDSFPYFLN
ncbi:hypothetical protein FQA39_LY07655 [Lamprigera yunnana]|nr:hypothetical protein FQA39_LY07655 [Lamprigera yunnana]